MINVLTISNSLIPSVLLCGHSQLEYLKDEGKLDYRFIDARFVRSADLSWADIIIYVRSESELEAHISKICKKAGKYQIYILDDDLLNVPDYLSSSKYYLRKDIQDNIRTIMSNCETFLTSSPVLLEKYGGWFKHAFQIHEPSLNAVSEKQANDRIRIGFAGSIDRSKDINSILEDSLNYILDRYQDKIEIEFMGARPEIVEKRKLNHIPYQDSYEKYTEVIKERNWDIGLAPMPESDFHRCKYFNKYVEYASFGIAGIYSDVEPYIFGIRDKENGLLVKNDTQSWSEALELLINDEGLRNKISACCMAEAANEYSLDNLAQDYYRKIIHGYTAPAERKEVKGFWKFQVKTLINQIIYKIREQGLNFPIWAIKKIFKILSGKR